MGSGTGPPRLSSRVVGDRRCRPQAEAAHRGLLPARPAGHLPGTLFKNRRAHQGPTTALTDSQRRPPRGQQRTEVHRPAPTAQH